MPGDPRRPQAQGDRCDRRAIRSLYPPRHPRSHGSDNGPEFVAEAVQEWIRAMGAKTAYIERGSPHAALGYKPPAPEVFVPALAAWPAALPRTAPPATLAPKPTLN